MTSLEAIKHQNELSRYYNLGHWYGIHCSKCCGVYPKLMVASDFSGFCWYECEVCHKKTEPCSMPWISENKWNNSEFEIQQLSLF